jgi:micrococcal nuclease
MKRHKKTPFRYTGCEVLKVLDGDTIDLRINCGFSIFVKKRVRFYGINTPETRTRDKAEKALGLACKERMKELVKDGVCDLDSYELGKFGRVIGVVWVGSKNLNKEMLKMEGVTEYYGGKR